VSDEAVDEVKKEEDASAPHARSEDAFARVKEEWGFPAFARSFPRDPELDRLVTEFARGNYRAVRDGAPALAASTTDAEVKRAAGLLRARIDPDRSARVFFALTAALLVFLSAWWITHDGDGGDGDGKAGAAGSPAPKPPARPAQPSQPAQPPQPAR